MLRCIANCSRAGDEKSRFWAPPVSFGRSLGESLALCRHGGSAATRQPARLIHPGIATSSRHSPTRTISSPPRGRGDHPCRVDQRRAATARLQLDGNLRTYASACSEVLQIREPARVHLLRRHVSTATATDRCPGTRRCGRGLLPRGRQDRGRESFIRAPGLPVSGTAIVLRPSIVYGPGQKPGYGTSFNASAARRKERPSSRCSATDARFATILRRRFRRTVGGADGRDGRRRPCVQRRLRQAPQLPLLDRIDATTGMPLRRVFRPARAIDVRTITLDNMGARRAFGWNRRWTSTKAAPGWGLVPGIISLARSRRWYR